MCMRWISDIAVNAIVKKVNEEKFCTFRGHPINQKILKEDDQDTARQ